MGWSLYPVAYLPGQSTMEISLTSGQFNADLFAMATSNRGTFKKTDGTNTVEYEMYKTEHLTQDATAHTVTLEDTPMAGSIYISGLTEGTEYTASGKTITFQSDGITTDEMEIHYRTLIVGDAENDIAVLDVDNKSAAIGEAVLKWPEHRRAA